MEEHKQLKGIFAEGRKIYTKNFAKGTSHFGENIVKINEEEFREFEPGRSKLGAAIVKKISQIGIREGKFVLYLGASHGYTPSFVSDIVGKNGFVFALDFAPRVVRDLVFVCGHRKNMAPILADANKPESYMHLVTDVDIVYQDIAQKNQVEIFLKNVELYLKEEGFALLAVKARSIDVTKNPKQLFEEVKKQLEKKITIVDYRELDPIQKAHAIFICKKNN